MEPILPHSFPYAASAARGFAEQGEKTGSPDTAPTGGHRFENILKSTAASQDRPEKCRPSAHGGRRAAIAGKEDKADTSTPPSVSAAAWGSVAPPAHDNSLTAAAGVASDPKDADSAKTDPAPVLPGAPTLAAEGDPLLKQLASGIHPAAANGEENAAQAQTPRAGDPGAVPAPHTAAASEPEGAGSAKADPAPVPAGASTLPAEGDPLLKLLASGIHPAAASEPEGAGSAKADPAPVPAGASTLPAEGDPLLKQLASGIHPAAANGEENAAQVPAPKAGDPGAVPAPHTASASEQKNAGAARVDGTPVYFSNTDPAPEGMRGAEGARKKKDDTFVRIEGQAEPAATSPAGGNLGVAERSAPTRVAPPASAPGVVRLEEKAFVITRKSDTSVEVTLAPPGVGKLEIEVALDKGVVNARIVAADSAGREAIARSLPQIVEALARDGMNVGGFTVSLKEKRDRTGGSPGHGASRDPDARLLSAVTQASSASALSAGLVNIFV